MSKKDFLQKKYEEINKLKNLLESYPVESADKIINSIKKITDEITDYIDNQNKKGKKTKRNKHRQGIDKKFSIEELAKYNGQNGNPSYVAVDGIVYDVSAILQWKNGNHYGMFAGQDLTDYILGCHKNKDILKNAKIVGSLEVK